LLRREGKKVSPRFASLSGEKIENTQRRKGDYELKGEKKGYQGGKGIRWRKGAGFKKRGRGRALGEPKTRDSKRSNGPECRSTL